MTANQKILDGNIRHMIWLERYKTSTAKKILTLLNKADADLSAKIAARLVAIEERGFDLGKQSTQRLNKLLDEIRAQRLELSAQLYGVTKSELNDFAEYEADFQARLVEVSAASVQVDLELTRPALSQLYAIATSQPFQGRLLKEWYNDLATSDARKISDALKMGMVNGETSDQIVRRIRGTRVMQYADGLLQISRRNAETIVRTAISHVADRAGQQLWEDNTDIVQGLKWVSTLDSRTSSICRERDGKIYPINKAPAIPAHFGCRSRKIPYLGATSVRGTRASAFGPVPDDVTYSRWLKLQPVSVQNEVLGVRKSKLFRDGGLEMDRFQDSTGRAYTLDELKKRDNHAWTRAFQ